MSSDELETLADEQYQARYKVLRKRFLEGTVSASQVEIATLTVLAGIQKTLLEIQDSLENLNYTRVGDITVVNTLKEAIATLHPEEPTDPIERVAYGFPTEPRKTEETEL